MKAATGQPPKKKRILLVDDHPLILAGMVQVINAEEDMVACGAAMTAATAMGALKADPPDLLVLDLRLKEGDGLEFIKSLKEQFSALRILALSQFDEALYAERAMRAGARGYLMKDQATNELIGAIRIILAGEIYLSRAMTNHLLQKSFLNRPKGVDRLTDRELQVLMLLGNGMSTRKIADDLHLSIKTVETYREHLKHKLRLPGSAELVRFATHWLDQSSRPAQKPDKSKLYPENL